VKDATTTLRQLEAYVQEEIGAQGRLLAALEAQDAALRSHEPERIAHATGALDAELEAQGNRAHKRRQLLESLASIWGVAASSLTLTSIAERAGDDGERLARQRHELERVTRRVQRLARRNTTIARFHQRLTADVLQALLVQDEGVQVSDGGALVDAEA
jgi:hypothetical protein